MTTSTDKTPAPKKPQGPIRWNAIIPFTILLIGAALYGKFFFDAHLKSALEWGGTTTHKADDNYQYHSARVPRDSSHLMTLTVFKEDRTLDNIYSVCSKY